MSYVPYGNDEPREFIPARGINCEHVINKHKKGTRGELVQLLDDADQNPDFPHLMCLPAKIRNNIYRMHFAEFPQPLYAPTQPPLTLTSRQVRREGDAGVLRLL